MKLWIARSESGILELFHEKPMYSYINKVFCYDWQNDDYIGRINPALFPEITFENSPQEVELKLVNK